MGSVSELCLTGFYSNDDGGYARQIPCTQNTKLNADTCIDVSMCICLAYSVSAIGMFYEDMSRHLLPLQQATWYKELIPTYIPDLP